MCQPSGERRQGLRDRLRDGAGRPKKQTGPDGNRIAKKQTEKVKEKRLKLKET